MAKYLDAEGVKTLWSKVKDNFWAKSDIDSTFVKFVDTLPTTEITHSLYLVKLGSTTQNQYAEYIYTGTLPISTTNPYDASKWEKLGEYKADVDLSGYAKKTEAASLSDISMSQGRSSIQFFFNTVDRSKSKTFTLYETSENNGLGLFSLDDKAKLDGIAANANNYSLPTASATVLGGVKVGNNLSISADGVLSGTADTHYSSKNVVTGTANQTTNGSGKGTIYLNHVESTGLTSSHTIKSTGATLVSSDTNGNITIQSTNTYVNKAAFEGNDETVTMTLTLSNGSTVTADIPVVDGNTNAGVISKKMAETLGAMAIKINTIANNATADSAITASELETILV